MLILAGVSINAIIGDDGIISRTQYSTFLSEMTAVEEAVQMWKAGEAIGQMGEETKAIPANGLCQVSDLNKTERLVGEVGYYRIWSMSETAPTTSIFSNSTDFNSAFEAEMIFFPAGVQDLFYLNNETLGIKSDKTYVIDAATGMIYSIDGIKLKGVSCYSANMATAVMSGNLNSPVFAESEVSGTGTDDKLAGNTEHEYGFEIISHYTNDNIYKLYNNGDLYGKGIKGTLLNSSETEMKSIDHTVWQEFVVPSEIPGSNDLSSIQLIPANGTMFVIDSNNELWAWGNNNSNKLGLTHAEQIDYTGLEAKKLNVAGKKVYKVLPNTNSTFVVTIDNGTYELYATGYNENGELGIGNRDKTQNEFMKVEFEHPEKITHILNEYGKDAFIIILTNEGKMYFAGSTSAGPNNASNLFKNTDLENTNVTKFVEIFNNKYGTSFSNKIISIYRHGNWNSAPIILLDNLGNTYSLRNGNVSNLGYDDTVSNVEKICGPVNLGLLKRVNSSGEIEFWGWEYHSSSSLGDVDGPKSKWFCLNYLFPEGFAFNKVKDIYATNANCYYLMEDGKVYASGYNIGLGIGVPVEISTGIICLNDVSNIPKIDSIIGKTSNGASDTGTLIFKGKDGKYYSTGDKTILFRDNILQKSWKIVAKNVKKFKANTTDNCLAYIDNNNDIWVCGDISTMLGINTSEDKKIPNFVLLKDYIKDTEVYEHINGKVEDYSISSRILMIKTNKNDNDTLYVCGKYLTSEFSVYNYNGLDNEDAFIPTKLADNVKLMACGYVNARFYVTNNNELYCWGHNNGRPLGMGSAPKLPSLNTDTTFSNVVEIISNSNQTYIIDDTNNIYGTGPNDTFTNNVNGFGENKYKFELLNSSNGSDELFKNMVSLDGFATSIALTDDGKIYGFGKKSKLGKGTTDETFLEIFDILPEMNNVLQIAGGNGWFVVITKDGKVYGTGSNTYGILGRWIGIDRKQPNSRYKTAFEWVECPELEI